MFDDGSSISILDESIAKQLGLKGNLQPLQLQWYGEQIHTEMSTRVSLEISGQDLNKFKLKNVCIIKNFNLPVQSFSKGPFPHLEFIPLIDYNNAKPSLLIGLDHAHLGATATLIQARHIDPIAAKTKLGWTVYGSAHSMSSRNRPMILHIHENNDLDQINKLIAEYFAADACTDVPTELIESNDDMRARKILSETTIRINNHFEVGLLWKN